LLEQREFELSSMLRNIVNCVAPAFILLFTALRYTGDKKLSGRNFHEQANPVWTTALAQTAVWLGVTLLRRYEIPASLYIDPVAIIMLVAVCVYVLHMANASAAGKSA
jgi:hypothetical protein